MTRGEILIPCTRGFAARAGIIPSLKIRMMGLAHFLHDVPNFEKDLLQEVMHAIGFEETFYVT